MVTGATRDELLVYLDKCGGMVQVLVLGIVGGMECVLLERYPTLEQCSVFERGE